MGINCDFIFTHSLRKLYFISYLAMASPKVTKSSSSVESGGSHKETKPWMDAG